MYFLYVGVDYTYIDVNALAQGIKSFLAYVCVCVCVCVCVSDILTSLRDTIILMRSLSSVPKPSRHSLTRLAKYCGMLLAHRTETHRY